MLGSILSVVLIGFSVSYEMAILARALGGVLDSTFPVVKTIIADSTDSSNKNKGFSAVALAYGLGIHLYLIISFMHLFASSQQFFLHTLFEFLQEL